MGNFQYSLKYVLLFALILAVVATRMIATLIQTSRHKQASGEEQKRHLLDDSLDSLRRELIPPAHEPYNLKGNELDPSQGQGRVVRKLTNYKTGGFFVECGGGNGEFYSNTLFLEKHLGWRGLLVEADPDNVKETLTLNRKAWVAPFCMSLNTSAYNTFFEKRAGYLGKIIPNETPNSFRVRCYPFHTFLQALNVTAVDYFSLDVEGDEVEVLETVPFDKVDIAVLSVEFSKSRGGLLGVKNLMKEKGYKVVTEVPPDDLIFVKNSHPIPDEELMLF